MRHFAWGAAAAALLYLGGSAPAAASLAGQAFTVSYQYPSLGTTYPSASASPASFTVGAGIESTVNVEDVTFIAVDFDASSLTLLFNTILTAPTWNGVAFNGLVFTAAAAHGITAAAVVPAATTLAGFDDSRISWDADTLRLNWGGLSYDDGTTIAIAFTFAPVPEPAALSLLGAGLVALATARRKRRAA